MSNKNIDKELKKILIKSTKEPLEHVLKLVQVKDSKLNRLLAIELYCTQTLAVINKTIKETLD